MKKIYGLDGNVSENRGGWGCVASSSFFHIQGDWFMSQIAIFSHILAFFLKPFYAQSIHSGSETNTFVSSGASLPKARGFCGSGHHTKQDSGTDKPLDSLWEPRRIDLLAPIEYQTKCSHFLVFRLWIQALMVKSRPSFNNITWLHTLEHLKDLVGFCYWALRA